MQHRDNLILEFWDRSRELNAKNNRYRDFVINLTSILLKNDIKTGDLTTNFLINANKNINAVIAAKESGIFAGLEEFVLLNRDLKIKPLKKDGDEIKNGDVLIKIRGNPKKILGRERTSLNLLQRMSGIATLTNSLVKRLDGKAMLAATRKTLWGGIDKKAVSIGGGLTHRLGLNDGIIIKDNHLKILDYDIEKALNLAKNKSKFIEVEVENKEQALNAANAIKKLKANKSKSVFAIMLDKINPAEIKLIVNELKKQNLHDYVLLEASGNINPDNLKDYSNSGVDLISMGFITNSAKALDISQEIK